MFTWHGSCVPSIYQMIMAEDVISDKGSFEEESYLVSHDIILTRPDDMDKVVGRACISTPVP